MAHLTRSQKYAQLSQQVANDKEQSTSTAQLADLEKRFNDIKDGLSNTKVEEPAPVVQEVKPVEEPAPVVEETIIEEKVEEPVQEEPSKYAWKDFDNSAMNDLESMLADLEKAVDERNAKEEEKVEEPVQEEVKEEIPDFVEEVIDNIPVYEESLVEEVKEESKAEEPVVEEVVEEVVEQPAQEEPVVEEVVEETTQEDLPEFEEPKLEDISVFEPEHNDFEEPEEIIDNTMVMPQEEPVEEVQEEVVSELPNADEQIFKDEVVTNNLFDEVKEDIDLHNKVNGEMDIDDITNTLVNQVRNEEKAEEKVEEPVAEEPVLDADKEVEYQDIPLVDEDDSEFSNTVSLEITKIMDEIPAAKPVENPLVDVVEEPTIVAPKVEEPVKEDENAVEIKNLKDIDLESENNNTVSSTIPFIIDAKDEDEPEEEEEDEEEGSNTILNIILIILIIVLVIVLGLIIFYILKTKGIL